MSNIWHTADEKPINGDNMVVYYSKEYDEELLLGYYNTEYEEFSPLDEFYCEEKTVKKWCYLNDLMALEPELICTRKALDVAVDALNKIYNAQGRCWGATDTDIKFDCKHYAYEALEQIESITKGNK